MNQKKLEAYVSALDDAGRDFSTHFARFEKSITDTDALNLGGSADIYLSQAITAADKFAACLELLSEDRPSFFTSSSIRNYREEVISHSRANLAVMSDLINSVPQSLRRGAEIALVMSSLRGR